MRTAVQDTSIAAYRAMPVKRLQTQADRIEQIVKARSRERLSGRPGRDISLKEIQRAHRFLHGDIELSTVSARVNALVAAKRLERLGTTRKCSISGISIHPVRVPG
jgi:hypothetical protein